MLNKHKSKLFVRPNVVAFASVMLVLLFVTMPLPKPMINPGVSVDTPHTNTAQALPKANREDALILEIQKDGTVYLKKSKVPPDRLPALIRQGIADGAEKRIYIKADARAKYGSIVEVLDAIRSAGIQDISFLAASSSESNKPIAPPTAP